MEYNFFKERYGLYFDNELEKNKLKTNRLYESWFTKVLEENLLPQIKIKLQNKTQDIISFWTKAGLILNDSDVGKKTRNILERVLLLEQYKTIQYKQNCQMINSFL